MKPHVFVADAGPKECSKPPSFPISAPDELLAFRDCFAMALKLLLPFLLFVLRCTAEDPQSIDGFTLPVCASHCSIFPDCPGQTISACFCGNTTLYNEFLANGDASCKKVCSEPDLNTLHDFYIFFCEKRGSSSLAENTILSAPDAVVGSTAGIPASIVITGNSSFLGGRWQY